MKDMFLPFKDSQEGSSEYLFDFENEDETVFIKEISENEIDVCVGEQLIKIFELKTREDVPKLESFNYSIQDVWFSSYSDVVALTEFTNIDMYDTWKKILNATLVGRFELTMPTDIHDFVMENN